MENPMKEAALGFGIKYGTTEGQKNDVVFEIQDLKKKQNVQPRFSLYGRTMNAFSICAIRHIAP